MKIIDNIVARITKIRAVYGVDAHILENGMISISAVKLILKSNKVIALEVYDNIGSRKKLWSFIGKNCPVMMTLNGKGILLRSTFNEIANTQDVVNNFLPSVNAQDFYVATESHGNRHYYYMIRKSVMEDEIAAWNNAGLQNLIGLDIGTERLKNVLPFIEAKINAISLASIDITLLDGAIIEISSGGTQQNILTDSVKIDGKYYNSTSLLALGNALDLIAKEPLRVKEAYPSPILNTSKKEYYYKKLFLFNSWAALSVLLVLLLVNYFLFSGYYQDNQALKDELQRSYFAQQEVEKIRTSLDSGFHTLNVNGWDKPTKNSFYADRIGALIPNTISLSSLSIQPKQEAEDFHGFLFSTNKILLSGISQYPEDLTMFIAALKNIPGVTAVQLSSYLYKNEIAASLFIIDISTTIQ